MGIVASIIGMSSFSSVFQFLRLNYSQIAFLRKRLRLDSKINGITNGLILGFFLGRLQFSLTSYLYGLKLAWFAETCFFYDNKSFR